MSIYILFLIIGYLFGSFPTGYLYSKSKGIDIFNVGSKNPGSTNVGRILGKKAKYIVFFGDILKTITPIIICVLISKKLGYISVFYSKLTIFVTGLGSVIGHMFPITLKFKGGKGVTSIFAVVCCFNIYYALIFFILQKIISNVLKIVSIASIIALILVYISSLFLAILYIYPFNFENSIIITHFILIMVILSIIKHKDNIFRLINKNENKF